MTKRPIRADAQRSRDRILETALQAFTERGTDASLDGIAREAGVGNATLYRHFPSREVLVEAVYRHEIERVGALADDLLATLPPSQALDQWMKAFVAFIATKHGMADVFHAVIAEGGDPYGQTRELVLDAARKLLAANTGQDAVRQDTDPLDLLTILNGLAYTCHDERQIERLLDLLMLGLRIRS